MRWTALHGSRNRSSRAQLPYAGFALIWSLTAVALAIPDVLHLEDHARGLMVAVSAASCVSVVRLLLECQREAARSTKSPAEIVHFKRYELAVAAGVAVVAGASAGFDLPHWVAGMLCVGLFMTTWAAGGSSENSVRKLREVRDRDIPDHLRVRRGVPGRWRLAAVLATIAATGAVNLTTGLADGLGLSDLVEEERASPSPQPDGEQQRERAGRKSRSGGDAKTYTSPSRNSSSAAATPPATYDAKCEGEPGAEAPPAQEGLLHDVFYGAGARVAGCAESAKPVDPTSGTWYAVGKCDSDETRSIGVADANGNGALLLQEAARFAIEKAHQGRLRGATRRQDIGAGDFHVVHTASGGHVLIRAEKNRGPAAQSPPSGPCDGLTGNNFPYTHVPPALIGPWLTLAAARWVWPTVVKESDGGVAYMFEDVNGRPVATGFCSSDQRCTVVANGETLAGSPRRRVTAGEVADLAPEPAAASSG